MSVRESSLQAAASIFGRTGKIEEWHFCCCCCLFISENMSFKASTAVYFEISFSFKEDEEVAEKKNIVANSKL